jgi:hypothetical protein
MSIANCPAGHFLPLNAEAGSGEGEEDGEIREGRVEDTALEEAEVIDVEVDRADHRVDMVVDDDGEGSPGESGTVIACKEDIPVGIVRDSCGRAGRGDSMSCRSCLTAHRLYDRVATISTSESLLSGTCRFFRLFMSSRTLSR